MLQPGQKAPLFTLPDQDDKEFSLASQAGKKVVLYFYPKDNTSGCTKEAQQFQQLSQQFNDKNAVIVGISKDSVQSHRNFADKYRLQFTLLADTDKTVIEMYGVWQEKKLYGKPFMGVVRTTYVIDENGYITNVYEKVKADGHAEQVLCQL